MSKLREIREALQANSGIVVVGVQEAKHLPNKPGLWSHIVDFYTAPCRGLYTVKELQALMTSLFPAGLRPTKQDDFCDGGSEIRLGMLCFDENIGVEHIRREIILTDEDMLSPDKPDDGRWVVENTANVRRRIGVRLFPNAKIAEAALRGKHEFQIFKRELRQYRGIMERLVGALS